MPTYRDLPGHSKVWIYQANRVFDKGELAEINELSTQFLSQWQAHGESLYAAIEVFYDLFIVVMVDEEVATATGCSIDSSFRFIQDLEKRLGISLLDRMNVAYRLQGKIRISRIDEFEGMIQEGKVNMETIVFNNLVDKKIDFDSKWEVLLKDSWHRKLLD